MKILGIAVPRNTNEIISIAGFALVVLATLGVRGVWPSWLVPVIGAFLGWVSIRDTKGFLVAGLALIGAKWGLGHVPMIGMLAQDFAQNLIALVAPAMLVVAIRSIYHEMRS